MGPSSSYKEYLTHYLAYETNSRAIIPITLSNVSYLEKTGSLTVSSLWGAKIFSISTKLIVFLLN